MLVADLFKSRTRLEAENLFLRHQLTIALRNDFEPNGGWVGVAAGERP